MTSTDEDVSTPTVADPQYDPDAAQTGPDASGPDSSVTGAETDTTGAESADADAGANGGGSIDSDADQAAGGEATVSGGDADSGGDAGGADDGDDAAASGGDPGGADSGDDAAAGEMADDQASDSTDAGTDGQDSTATDASTDPNSTDSTDAANNSDVATDPGTDATDDAAGGAAANGADTIATGADQTSDPIDLGPPYLIVDQYSGDSGKNPPWANLVARPEFYGVILKAWEGAHFNDGGWFTQNWPAVKLAGGDRYGSTWFRGAYLFLKFDTSPVAQADAYLQVIRGAGGWDDGDILPVVDVELGAAANTNRTASRQQVIDCVSQCAARLKEKTSRRVMLYGRGAMRDLGITDKMGCDVVWNPSYTPTMHKAGLEAFALDDIVLWQYCGDNQAYLPDYPHQVTGFAKIDISVFVKGTSKPTLDDVRTGLLS